MKAYLIIPLIVIAYFAAVNTVIASTTESADTLPADQVLGYICYKDGSEKEITTQSAIWMAKMIDGETWGRPSQEDANSMLWSIVQRTVLPSWRHKKLYKKIQQYSQPINPRWTKTGNKCSKYYSRGYAGKIPNKCSQKRVNKRANNIRKEWKDTALLARKTVIDFIEGSIPNPVIGVIGWYAPKLWERRERKGKNTKARQVFHSQIDGNVYFARNSKPNTTNWKGFEVTVVSKSTMCPMIIK